MSNQQNQKKGRVLVLDDMKRWRQALVEILKQDGYDAEAVSSVSEVLSKLQQSLYHVLILDICLNESDHGNIDGWELLRKISALGLDDALKVMMVSAHETNEQVRDAFHDYNVSDFIIKSSFDKKEFQASVQRIFEKDLQINLKLATLWQQCKSETVIRNLVSVPSSGSRKDIDAHRSPTGKVYTPNPNGSSGNALRRDPRKRKVVR